MANTTNFGWETPDDTDLVKDGAAAMRTLGNSIDASFVDLKGGTTGQILSKNSNTDLDFVWIANDQGDITAVTAGTGISGGGTSGAVTITNSMATEITAAGDIIVGTGSGTFDNLPIGTTGQVLTADTTVSPYKVKWAAVSGATFVGCRIRKSTSQSIANNTTTTLTFNEETYDTDDFHDNTTNNSRITIPSGKGGYYHIFGNIVPGTQTSGQWNFSLYINNSLDTYYPSSQSGSASNRSVTISDIRNLSAGDYLELKAYQDSGGSINVFGTDNNMTFWGVRFLG